VSVGGSFHVARNVGRLIELRPEPLNSVDVVSALGNAIRAVVRQLGTDAVFCVDWRRLRLLAPEVADALTSVMKGGNGRVVRSAALIGENATFGLQVERLIKAADSASRRAFRNPKELLDWLGEVTTPEETERARQFLLGT
jgi:hypothetical protein